MNNSLMNESLRFKIAHNVKNYIDLDDHHIYSRKAKSTIDYSHSDDEICTERRMIANE
jgi:hypothetical protein